MVHNPLTVLSGANAGPGSCAPGFHSPSGGLKRVYEWSWMGWSAQQSNKPQKIQKIFPVGGFETNIFTLNRLGVILLFGLSPLSPTGRPSPNVCLISSWLPPGRCRVKWRSVRMDNSFWILALSSSSWQKRPHSCPPCWAGLRESLHSKTLALLMKPKKYIQDYIGVLTCKWGMPQFMAITVRIWW